MNRFGSTNTNAEMRRRDRLPKLRDAAWILLPVLIAALWSCSSAWHTLSTFSVQPVVSMGQLGEITGIPFPPAARLVAGEVVRHPSGVLYARVLIPHQQWPPFLEQETWVPVECSSIAAFDEMASGLRGDWKLPPMTSCVALEGGDLMTGGHSLIVVDTSVRHSATAHVRWVRD